jgi:hypothetical protein
MDAEEYAECLAVRPSNRRNSPRYAIEGFASLLLVEHGSSIACNILDLSMGGCQLRTQDRFPAGIGVLVEVSFKVHGIILRFRGKVQWKAGDCLFGIRFSEMTPRRREDLAGVLGEVEEDSAADANQFLDDSAGEKAPAR